MDGLYAAFVERAPVALVALDTTARVVAANAEATRMIGPNLIGRAFGELFVEAFAAPAAAFADRLATEPSGTAVFFEAEATHPDGTPIWVEARGTSCADLPDVAALLVVLHNATETRRRIEQLRRRSLEDPLTGLPNRTLLLERLTAARRAGSGGAVIYLDLDQFKLVNDMRGHAAGDTVLVAVAHRIAAAVSTDATVARVGGDEFLVLLPDGALPDAERVAEALIGQASQPIDVAGTMMTVTASAGVAALDAPSPDSVLRNADVALYEAKAGGRAQVRTYRPDSAAFARSRRDLLRQVDALLERNEELAAQALTDPTTGLANRRAFDDALLRLDATSRRGARSYAVAYFDLDFFHDVNRAFDDDTGDATLRAVAEAMTDACRVGDVVYRKGGEELVALFPDTGLDAAQQVAQRLADRVRGLGLPTGRTDRSAVTISGGVAALDVTRHASPSAVVADANQAMLVAKRTGRDRICRLPEPGAAVEAG